MPETQEQRDASQAVKQAQAYQKARVDAAQANAAANDKVEEEQVKLRQQIADLEAKMAEMTAGPQGYVTVDHTDKVVR